MHQLVFVANLFTENHARLNISPGKRESLKSGIVTGEYFAVNCLPTTESVVLGLVEGRNDGRGDKTATQAAKAFSMASRRRLARPACREDGKQDEIS